MYKAPDRIWLPILLLIILFQSSLYCQNNIIEFDSDKWNMVNAEQIEYLGRNALRGFAILKDVEFENGIIEYDMATDGSPDIIATSVAANKVVLYKQSK